MAESIDDIVQAIRAFARQRMGGFEMKPTDMLRIDPDNYTAKRGVVEYPDEDMFTVRSLLLLNHTWKDLSEAIQEDFRKHGVEYFLEPKLFAAPTGDLNAFSIMDNDGRGALIFDTELLNISEDILWEISKLVFRPVGSAYKPLGSTTDPRLLAAIELAKKSGDGEIAWISRKIINWLRVDRNLINDESHSKRRIHDDDWNIFNYMADSFRRFLIGHEYAHYHYQHHHILYKAEMLNLDDHEMRQLRYNIEGHADDFGYKAAIFPSTRRDNDADGLSIAADFAALTFFYLLDTLEEVEALIDALSRRPQNQVVDVNWLSCAVPEARERLISDTHPPAMTRLSMLSKSISETTNEDVDLDGRTSGRILSVIFGAAKICAMSAIIRNPQTYGKDGIFRNSDRRDDSHLRII